MNNDEDDNKFFTLVNEYAGAIASFVAIDELDDHGPSQRLGIPRSHFAPDDI